MGFMLKIIGIAGAMALLAGGANANGLKASNPDGIMEFLKLEGISARLTEDDYGDPNIKNRYYDTNFSIYFYGCSDGKNCSSVQFYSGYKTEGSYTQEQANEWNQRKRFAKAYVSSKGSARIEMDIYMGDGGISEDDFSEMFSIWTRRVSDFEEDIDW